MFAMLLPHLVIAVLTLISYLLYYLFIGRLSYWKKRNVRGPKPIPFFGNLKESTLRQKSYGVVLRELYEQFPGEKVIGIYRMTTPVLLVRDPEIIKQVLIKDFDLFIDRGVEFSKKGLGLNLFHSDGESWRMLRNKFTPLFTSGKLKNMLYLMCERGDKFVEYVDNICRKQPEQDILSLVQKYTIATISACAFGLDIDVEEIEQMKTLEKIDKNIFTPNYAFEVDYMFPGIFKIIGASLFPKYLSAFFKDLVLSVISQRKGVATNRKDFMDLILEMRQAGKIQGLKRHEDDTCKELELTDDVIAAQAFVFYAAGYETSASTINYMLYQMALNPDIQEKLVAEIKDVLQRHNGKITYEAICEMKYMEQVFDETLRLYPPVDQLQRNTQDNYKIPGTDVTIEKGQMIAISVTGIHHDDKYYPDSEKFDPERFSSENSKARNPCTYIPFGMGPRNCIGMRFAQVQSRVCLSYFLPRFRVEPTENTIKHMQYNPMRLVLAPKNKIFLNVIPRK